MVLQFDIMINQEVVLILDDFSFMLQQSHSRNTSCTRISWISWWTRRWCLKFSCWRWKGSGKCSKKEELNMKMLWWKRMLACRWGSVYHLAKSNVLNYFNCLYHLIYWIYYLNLMPFLFFDSNFDKGIYFLNFDYDWMKYCNKDKTKSSWLLIVVFH